MLRGRVCTAAQRIVGVCVCRKVGAALTGSPRMCVGRAVGAGEGASVGRAEGARVGGRDGTGLGWLGCRVGGSDGTELGWKLGRSVGPQSKPSLQRAAFSL